MRDLAIAYVERGRGLVSELFQLSGCVLEACHLSERVSGMRHAKREAKMYLRFAPLGASSRRFAKWL